MLQENLYEGLSTLVLTGATLQAQGSFAYLQERLGLEDAETLALGSPFDYRRAALVLVPRDMPEPEWPAYLESLSQAIADLVRASHGRALVLFTSHSSLRATHRLVSELLQDEAIQVLGQGIDGSARQLVRALQSNPNTVLLGTASFWEGVDIVGEALSLLVMTRLPFNVPSDPVFAARAAMYDDSFAQYALPQAVLRFKQGFGRLIRSKTDTGRCRGAGQTDRQQAVRLRVPRVVAGLHDARGGDEGDAVDGGAVAGEERRRTRQRIDCQRIESG